MNKAIVAVTEITLDKTELPLTVGGNYTLTATVKPDDATDKSVTYESDDTDVAMVDQNNGKVVGVGAGTATITATSVQNPDIKATCTVTVSSVTIDVTGITLQESSVNLECGKTVQLHATVQPTDATNQKVRWESDHTDIVTVGNAGLLTGVKAGTARVTVTTVDGGFSKSCDVTVVDTPITSLTFVEGTGSAQSVEYGSTTTLTLDITPDNASNKSVEWKSNVAAVTITPAADGQSASISFSGSYTGNVTITATSLVTATASASQAFKVWCKPTALSANPSKITLIKDATQTISLNFTPSYTTEKGCTYQSADESVATVSDAGVVTAIAAGTTEITVTSTAVSTLSSKVTVEVIGENKVSINGETAVSYLTGQLESLLKDKTVTSIAWEGGLIDTDDVIAFYTYLAGTLQSADISKLSFVPDPNRKYSPLSSYTTYSIQEDATAPYLFFGFTKLKSLVLPAKKAIGHYCVHNTALTSLVIPDGVETLQRYAIDYNLSLKSVTIPSTLKNVEAFGLSRNFLEGTLDLTSVETIEAQAFQEARNVTCVKFGPALKSINAGFESCNNLASFVIEGENAKYSTKNGWLYTNNGKKLILVPQGDSKATGNVTIPDGVETIGNQCFSNYGVTSVTLPEGLSRMDHMYVFGYYKGTYVELPSTIEYMCYLSFAYSSNLTEVKCKAVTPPTIHEGSATSLIFHACNNLTAIYVPAESVDAYKAATGWAGWGDKIKAIPEE